MIIHSLENTTNSDVPLMACFPYRIDAEPPADHEIEYDPTSQLTVYAGRNYSTCRDDESRWTFVTSAADTRKDD